MQYGSCVYGMPNTTLQKVRGFACAVKGEMRGRSTLARLELARYDPGIACAISPIEEWAKAIWDTTAKCEDLRVVWQRARTLMASSPTPFRHVAGPGGAMLASCRRIGWRWPRYDVILRADGSPLRMNLVCPAEIRLHAARDLRAIEAANSSLAKRIGGPPDLEPLGDFLATENVSNSPAAASLRALGEGGWWTQARLHQEGRVDTPWCKACGRRGGVGPAEGTLHHRLCSCSATAALWEKFKDQDILRKAQSALRGHEALFQHGVPLLSTPPKVPSREVNSCGGKQMPEDFSASGNAFTDGAMRGRAPKAARRAAWSWVVVDDEGSVIFGLYGPCADPFPTAFRAELRAVCELLVLAIPPLTIWVDNQEVIDGWLKGKVWCLSSARSAADLWSEFWQRLYDIGSDDIVLRKTKGHATDVDVLQGRSTAFEKAGNDHADHFAGRGVDIAIHRCPNASALDDYRVASRWYRWVLQLCANWPDDVEEKPRVDSCKAAACSRKRPAKKAVEGEEDEEAAMRRRCEEAKEAATRRRCEEDKEAATRRRCQEDKEAATRRQAEGGAHSAEDESEKDTPPAANRYPQSSSPSSSSNTMVDCAIQALEVLAQSKALHPSHSLKLTGGIVWCNNCAAYTQERFKALRAPCSGPQHARSRGGQLANLRSGKHPLSGKVIGNSARLTIAAAGTSSTRRTTPSAPLTSPLRLQRSDTACAAANSVGAIAVVTALSRPICRAVGHAFGKLV